MLGAAQRLEIVNAVLPGSRVLLQLVLPVLLLGLLGTFCHHPGTCQSGIEAESLGSDLSQFTVIRSDKVNKLSQNF